MSNAYLSKVLKVSVALRPEVVAAGQAKAAKDERSFSSYVNRLIVKDTEQKTEEVKKP